MKVALLSESPADEAALRVLVAAVLGQRPQYVGPGYRARGWPNVVHTDVHDAPGYFHPHCRMCQLRAVYRQTTRRLPPVNGRERVLRAVGVAVPAMEAWYLCGRDETVSEAAWIAGQKSGRMPYTRLQLKRRVYGTDRPSLGLQTACAVREAERHRRDTRRLENDFPGFAALAADLRHRPEPAKQS
jgi:hypothetical protein